MLQSWHAGVLPKAKHMLPAAASEGTSSDLMSDESDVRAPYHLSRPCAAVFALEFCLAGIVLRILPDVGWDRAKRSCTEELNL